MKKIILLLLICVSYTTLKADKANTLWQLANHAYESKNYEAAINLYDSILKQNVCNAELYYNAGNAYYKNHNIGMAVWCFEKAHQLAPNDEDIETNLKICNLRLVDKIDAAPNFILFRWWDNFLHFFAIKIWAIITICFLWCMLIGLLLYYFSFQLSNIGKWLIRVGFCCGILFLIITWQAKNNFDSNKFLIVMASNINIKAAPDESSTDLYVIHEGTKALLLKSNQNWSYIKLSDGKVGWCLNSEMKLIE
jgi:tetratricopeptide (TPR) repeat protein